MLVSVWKKVPKSAVWLLLAAGAALLILLPRGGASLSTPSALPGDAASARPGRRCRRLSSSPSRA